MEKEAFEILRNIENTWWDYGRKQAIGRALDAAGAKKLGKVLDVGAGYGGMLSLLSLYGSVDAIEPDLEAAQVCKKRGYSDFFSSDVEAVSSNKKYDLIGAFDVIEHIQDDSTFVSHLHTLNSENGLIVAAVPAYQWLWSVHDVKHMHFRRHTIKSMSTLLKASGYEVVYARHWNVFLFPIVLLTRLLGRSGEAALHPHLFVEKVLKVLLWIEARVVRYIPIPFGLSVVIVGRKK